MAKYKIAWLPGDGIGKDVLNAAKIVLDKLKLDAEYIPGDIGWEFWCKEGNALPERTIELLKKTDCCLFGAITSKPKEEAEAELDPGLKGKRYVYTSPIVKLRQLFNLRTNLRPCKAYPGNPLNYRNDIDIVVFRENTEDLYSGVEFHALPKEVMDVLLKNHSAMKKFEKTPLEDIAVSLRILTRKACQNIVLDAFEYAKKHKRRSVAVVEKPNVIRETSGLMIREARKIAKEYPEIPLWETNIDAMCMWLIKNPQDYDVLVTSNMFGDIVSDLCAQLVGGLGFASSGNIGDDYAVFEPTHGSAPKHAGMNRINPMAMMLSGVLMLRHLGEKQAADNVEKAIARVIREGKKVTYDLKLGQGGNPATTSEVAEAVIQAMEVENA